MPGVQRSATARRRRLDQLHAAVFEPGLTDAERDVAVLKYVTVRARQPWRVIIWHELRHMRHADAMRAYCARLGIDPAHHRVISWRLVRP